MSSNPQGPSFSQSVRPVAKVLVATTAMLAFISYWRAAAIVLNDIASSAYYAGGEAEQFIGKTAPWFIFATMLLSYAVFQLYVESCSMFVRGGVYRVVKEAMGGALAKFSVSALMFDYILTGPISGVSAGQYLAGLLNELFAYAHLKIVLNADAAAAAFAIVGDDLFLVGKHQGHSRIEREGAVDHAAHHGDGGGADRVVRLHAAGARRASAAGADSAQHRDEQTHAGLASRNAHRAEHCGACRARRAGPFRAGHERRGIAGAGLPRNRAPEAAEPEESGVGNFHLQHGVHVAGFLLCGDDYSGQASVPSISRI